MGPVVCEVLDARTQKTIENNSKVQKSSEFCQTNKLIGQIMAMISENRSVKVLLDEMLGNDGCKVAVFPAQHLVGWNETVSFWTIAKRASRFDMVIIGYQQRFTVSPFELNPANKDEPMQWELYDLAAIVPGNDDSRHANPARHFSRNQQSQS